MSLLTDKESGASNPRQPPLAIAPDTFVLRGIYQTPAMSTNLNAMLIRGSEPMLVDTGMGIHQASWWEDVCSLVEPEEVRWIFITHDDFDHTGNLLHALAHCPNAGLIVNHASSWRTSVSFGIPPERIRTVENGQVFELGDRQLLPLRPPVFDSPYTLGLYDARTRIYYASDAFCAPMPVTPIDYVIEMPGAEWADGLAMYHQNSLCPWISLVDRNLFSREVARLATLEIDAIAGAHTPVIPRQSVESALELLSRLPDIVPDNLALAGVGDPMVKLRT